MMGRAEAARVVVELGRLQDDGTAGSTRRKKAAARFFGALEVWEALTGLRGREALDAARREAEG
jgi:hypothetical protein